ncbi:MAG: DUF423 domain-containing protein, partial [Sediminibacterium sp.]
MLGAFVAHALISLINIERLAIFETGVRYQFMHGAGLLFLALYAIQSQKIEVVHKGILWASKFFIMGVF